MAYTAPDFTTTAVVNENTKVKDVDEQINILMGDVKEYLEGNFEDIVGQTAGVTGYTKAQTDALVNVKANDNTVVKLTGDQTIAGVKTFSSSPTVPTPTADFQAANKAYIDTQITGLGTAATRDVGESAGNVLSADIVRLELGQHRSGDRDSYIDFHSYGEPGAINYSARIVREQGENGHLIIANTGAGDIIFFKSPRIPTPTTNSQAANMKFVLDNAGISLATANSYDLGVGQTWQDVTASRIAGVTYTNTTGKPIEFKVIAYGTDAGSSVIVDGIEVEVNDVGLTTPTLGFTSSAIVPNGSTYSYGLKGGASHKVYELR